jgi:hypothetical protein
VEETFQAGKGLAGLDEHQLRRYTSWSRWVTLAMLAHAFLAVVRADEHARHPTPHGLIPLTCNEIQRLFTTLVLRPMHDVAHRLHWSAWRRRHQARAQGQPLPPTSREPDMKITIYGWSISGRHGGITAGQLPQLNNLTTYFTGNRCAANSYCASAAV